MAKGEGDSLTPPEAPASDAAEKPTLAPALEKAIDTWFTDFIQSLSPISTVAVNAINTGRANLKDVLAAASR